MATRQLTKAISTLLLCHLYAGRWFLTKKFISLVVWSGCNLLWQLTYCGCANNDSFLPEIKVGVAQRCTKRLYNQTTLTWRQEVPFCSVCPLSNFHSSKWGIILVSTSLNTSFMLKQNCVPEHAQWCLTRDRTTLQISQFKSWNALAMFIVMNEYVSQCSYICNTSCLTALKK